MDNEIQQNFFLIISLIVIIIIKHNEFEETLITSYPTDLTYPIEQEENNILFLSLLCSQFHRIEVKECIDLRRISRSISQAWFYEICMNMQDFEFKRHFRMTRSTFEWLCCEIIPLLRRDNNNPGPGLLLSLLKSGIISQHNHSKVDLVILKCLLNSKSCIFIHIS